MRFWPCLFAALAVGSAARAAPALEDFAATPRISEIVLSPSGDRFATIGAEGDLRRLYVRRADGTVDFAADLGQVQVDGVIWAGDDKLILFTRNVVGGGVTILVRQALTSGIVVDLPIKTVKGIFKDSTTVVGAVSGWFGVFQIDGHWIAFVGGTPFEKITSRQTGGAIYPDLYRLDLGTMAYARIARAGEGRTSWVVAPDGAIVGHSSFDDRGRVQTIYAGAGTDRPLLAHPLSDGKLELDGLGRTADSLLLADRTSGEEVARELKVSAPGAGEVLYSHVEKEQALRDPATGLLIGMTSSDGASGADLVSDAARRRVAAAAKAFPGAEVRLVSFISSMDRMVVYTESASDSGTYWLVDIVKKSARPIGSARPLLKAEDLGEVRLIAYRASDGTAMDGVLTLPPKSAGKGLPLVVMPHAGPLKRRDEPRLDPMAQAFASRGYAVFQPNFRGTLGYGEAFRALAVGEVGKKMQTDISDGVASLAASGTIDPRRVCIVGVGYGGYAALAGVTLQTGLYRCAVGRSGIYDLPAFSGLAQMLFPGDQRQQEAFRAPMGPVDGEDLAAISPARRADQADAPVMLIYEEAATEGWVTQSKKMEQGLKRAGKAVEVYVQPDPTKAKTANVSDEMRAKALLTATVAFVEKNNPPN